MKKEDSQFERAVFERAVKLQERLSHYADNNQDVLSVYRKWLDREGIDAESEEGWPTENVYDETNISNFINYLKENFSLCCSAPIDEKGFCQDCKEHAQ